MRERNRTVLLFKIVCKSSLQCEVPDKHHSSPLDGAAVFFPICPSKFVHSSLMLSAVVIEQKAERPTELQLIGQT